LAEDIVLTAKFFPRRHQIGDIYGKAAGVDKFFVPKIHARGDLDVFDGTIPRT
jgi:hypothetical protein